MKRSEIDAAYLVEVSNIDRKYEHALEMADRRRDERLEELAQEEPSE
jgi:hypothetical protein